MRREWTLSGEIKETNRLMDRTVTAQSRMAAVLWSHIRKPQLFIWAGHGFPRLSLEGVLQPRVSKIIRPLGSTAVVIPTSGQGPRAPRSHGLRYRPRLLARPSNCAVFGLSW